MVTNQHDLNCNVLLVEDHDALREVMIETLEAYGHHVVGVDCAEAVCELPPSQRFDVAVLDLNLPGEDGLALAQRLRAVQPTLGIIMVTARHERADKRRGYQHGADMYLSKPVDAEELALALQALARRLKRLPAAAESSYQLDRQALSLILPQQRIGLTSDEVTILQALALAADHTLESWQLLEVLGRDLDEHGKKQLEVIISRLRRKLKTHGLATPLIRAERGKGYRLCVTLRLI